MIAVNPGLDPREDISNGSLMKSKACHLVFLVLTNALWLCKMLASGKVVWTLSGNSLSYPHNFSVNTRNIKQKQRMYRETYIWQLGCRETGCLFLLSIHFPFVKNIVSIGKLCIPSLSVLMIRRTTNLPL